METLKDSWSFGQTLETFRKTPNDTGSFMEALEDSVRFIETLNNSKSFIEAVGGFVSFRKILENSRNFISTSGDLWNFIGFRKLSEEL